MDCRFCGTWSGLFDNQHQDCLIMYDRGMTLDQIRNAANAPTSVPLAARPVTPVSIFWAVFLALLAFSLLMAFLVLIFK